MRGPLGAARLGLPTTYGVQALEPTRYWAAPYPSLLALYQAQPVYERFGRELAERLLVHKERRARSLLQEDAATRYRQFVEGEPGLGQRVPLYHVASYLGITPESLSRIRRADRTRPILP